MRAVESISCAIGRLYGHNEITGTGIIEAALCLAVFALTVFITFVYSKEYGEKK